MKQSALLERTPESAMRVFLLEWDSEQFGFPAARLEIDDPDEASLAEILSRCRECGVRHLVTRVSASASGVIHLLERGEFCLLDGLQTFTLGLERTPSLVSSLYFAVRPYAPEDLSQVLAIAKSSYVHDRFHADSSLPAGVADRINEKWVENCCRGVMADVIYVAEKEGEILGFVTGSAARRDTIGKIGMLAVAESWRRRGVARAITVQVLHWMRARQIDEASVGTQLANIAAARLYQALGFRTTAVHFTYRKII